MSKFFKIAPRSHEKPIIINMDNISHLMLWSDNSIGIVMVGGAIFTLTDSDKIISFLDMIGKEEKKEKTK